MWLKVSPMELLNTFFCGPYNAIWNLKTPIKFNSSGSCFAYTTKVTYGNCLHKKLNLRVTYI